MKIWVINKKKGFAVLSLAIIMAIFAILGRNAVVPTANSERDLPIYCVEKSDEDKVVAISFDAAWGNEDTEELIKILDKYKVKTTFFVVGSWVDKYPESVKALHDGGHEVMNHSNSHPHMTSLSKEKMLEEVRLCDEKIEKVTGVKPTLFRTPYGDYNNEVVGAMRESGHYTIQWDVDSLDWKNLSSEEITERVISKVKPGSIVLFHNAALNTPKALPVILEKLLAKGYKIVPVSEIILKENYKVDQSGMQCPIEAENSSSDSKSKEKTNPSAPVSEKRKSA